MHSRGLIKFFAASLALHALALAIFARPSRSVGVSPDSAGSVVYLEPSGVRAPRESRKLVKPRPSSRAGLSPAAAELPPAAIGEGRGNAPAAAAPGANDALHTYLSSLRAILAERQTYPEAARAAGESGNVEVGLRIGSDGGISDVRLTRPSEFASLNQAALALVRGLGRVPALPTELPREGITLRIPLEYALGD